MSGKVFTPDVLKYRCGGQTFVVFFFNLSSSIWETAVGVCVCFFFSFPIFIKSGGTTPPVAWSGQGGSARSSSTTGSGTAASGTPEGAQRRWTKVREEFKQLVPANKQTDRQTDSMDRQKERTNKE